MKNILKKIVKISLIFLCLLIILGILFVALFINSIMEKSNVTFDKNKLLTVNNELIVFDKDNNKIESTANEKTTVNIEELPNHVINAFISIEDKKFFEHKGLNYKRIVKAAINNIKSLSFKEGASTISQQLIKNTHLSNEKTIKRKINEIVLTKKLEKEFSKKDILETYLNVIYFGENSYGIESASKAYFNKSASELSIEEAATLAGIIKSPYNYSPVYNYDKCLNRRNLVLSEMLKDKKITKVQHDAAISEPIILNTQIKTNNTSDLYIKGIIKEAEKLLNLTEQELRMSGFKIYSYLDNDVQTNLFNIANNEENYHVNSFGNINDSLLILIDNNDYSVLGYAGKSNYDLTSFNRQPGSAIKPILVYAPALENGLISAKTLILDEEVDYNGYKPKNVGNKNYGYVSVEDSLCESLNIPAVKIMDYVGIEKCKDYAKNLGIEFNKRDTGLALALGGFTEGVNLKDLTNAYLPFSNGGNFDKARFIKKIVDSNGKIIYERNINKKQVMNADTAYLMTDMLKTACKQGTSKKLKDLNFDVAGKTGTVAIKGTNNNTDAYSIAYTTQHTIGVWIGNYSNNKEYVLEGKNNGGTFATNMIKIAFENLYKETKPENFNKPESVKEIEIDLLEYENNKVIKLANDNCPARYKMKALVSKRYMPTEYSSLFKELRVDNFDVKLEEMNAKISFDAKDYYKYEIVKVDGGKSKTIKTVSNKNDRIVFYDVNLENNKKYDYYILIKSIDNNSNSASETIQILTPKKEEKYNKLLKFNDGVSWLFH